MPQTSNPHDPPHAAKGPPPAGKRRMRQGVAILVVLVVLGGLALHWPFGRCEPASFRIVAGSGNAVFEPILRRFAEQRCLALDLTYQGSLDIMKRLETGTLDDDAIWDADSLWTTLGDEHHLIRDRESIMRSPVVLGIKRPVAARLGWIGADVDVPAILAGIEREKLRLMMTSATQSNSGASAYLGFLSAFSGSWDPLTVGDLRNPAVRVALKTILMSIDRTSESSGWLRDLFAREYASYDGMFNYESHIIELNQSLVKQGRDPLYVVYPTPGLGIADFPLSYVDHGDRQKHEIFDALRRYLLSAAVQREFAAKGRRVGAVGTTPDAIDETVFNPAWGVDAKRVISPLRLPDAPVIREALDLYQSVLRKPSFTVYVLDFSTSMSGEGERQVKRAMRILLDQREAAKYLLQGSPDDITMIIPFDDEVRAPILQKAALGNDQADLMAMLGEVERNQAGGGTDIYAPTAMALRAMRARGIDGRLPAVILMTDGRSQSGAIGEVADAIAETGLKTVPVYAITFGDADPSQLGALAALTGGRVFDGTRDLIAAFRQARGSN